MIDAIIWSRLFDYDYYLIDYYLNKLLFEHIHSHPKKGGVWISGMGLTPIPKPEPMIPEFGVFQTQTQTQNFQTKTRVLWFSWGLGWEVEGWKVGWLKPVTFNL